jgi:two-component system CheB/CheR fusion protein
MTSRPKVFIVEDNADARYLLVLLLERAGYPVEAVASLRAASDAFGPSASEILLSDVGLPDGSGRDLLRQLTAEGQQPYAIAMSGFGTPSDIAESLRAGFRHHLVKPVDAEMLERVLEDACAELRDTVRSP